MLPLAHTPESMEGRQRLEFTIREEGEVMVAVLTRQDLMDDAIGAEEVRVEFDYNHGQWTPIAAYERHQCRRGPGSGWTIGACL